MATTAGIVSVKVAVRLGVSVLVIVSLGVRLVASVFVGALFVSSESSVNWLLTLVAFNCAIWVSSPFGVFVAVGCGVEVADGITVGDGVSVGNGVALGKTASVGMTMICGAAGAQAAKINRRISSVIVRRLGINEPEFK